jgi:2-methylcitrate dehydratase
MTGPAPIFEGDLGFMKLLTRTDFQVAPMGAENGAAADFMLAKTYIKFWPAEYHSQSAIDAALQLRPDIGDPAGIQAIDIHTFDACYDIIGKYPEAWAPRTRETADHSLPYCTAVALADGDVTLAQFEPERFTDPALLALVAKVKVHRDSALSGRYPAGIPNRLTVMLQDGRRLVKEVEFPRGHAQNPMTDEEVEAKFRRLVEPRFGKKRTSKMLRELWNLPKWKNTGGIFKLFKSK